ncbi:retrovirus-related pol polyprotein from transposon TNT 1-94 [Tanacetum coccineum]
MFVLSQVVQIVLWYLDSGCSRHMTGDRARLINFVEKFIGTVRFGNDEYAAIVGYGDYKLGDTIISRVYYVEGLKHNLFSVGQFCDGGLEVAFRQHSCHIRNYDMVDLLNGSRTTNLYSISLNDMLSASPVCLLTKASSTKSWLWHRRLNHLNFGTLNELARKNLVRGLPMLKYDKDHLCPSCQLGKSKKASHPLKTENTNTEVLHTLHMDLCGPMRTESINGKKYVLVIVDDYTRFGFGWCKADIGIFVGYAPTSRRTESTNKRTRKILGNNSVAFDELTDGLTSGSRPVQASLLNIYFCEKNAMVQLSTTVISEGAPAVTESLLPHQNYLYQTLEEIHEFERLDVWILVPCPDNILIIPLKWIFKIKLDEYGEGLKNKSVMAKGYRQEAGIDILWNHLLRLLRLERSGLYTAHAARRICRSRASIACVPSYEALYGLKQAPHAWYDKLSAFLIKSGFTKGVVDQLCSPGKQANIFY